MEHPDIIILEFVMSSKVLFTLGVLQSQLVAGLPVGGRVELSDISTPAFKTTLNIEGAFQTQIWATVGKSPTILANSIYAETKRSWPSLAFCIFTLILTEGD